LKAMTENITKLIEKENQMINEIEDNKWNTI
jgi:hypothetical protein